MYGNYVISMLSLVVKTLANNKKGMEALAIIEKGSTNSCILAKRLLCIGPGV